MENEKKEKKRKKKYIKKLCKRLHGKRTARFSIMGDADPFFTELVQDIRRLYPGIGDQHLQHMGLLYCAKVLVEMIAEDAVDKAEKEKEKENK